MDKRGITLIELIIVMAIISILAMIAIPTYLGQQKKAARTEAYSNLQNLRLLEEQFFAENGAYTASLGSSGNSEAVRDANLAAISAVLPGFRPGDGASFSYRIIQNNQLNTPVAIPPVWAASPAGTFCFTAVATGLTGTRVSGDMFAIDCFNNKSF